MIQMRTNGLIPKDSWEPVDIQAALWRVSLVLDKDQISVEEYKKFKRPHWPSAERIVEWGDGDWDSALAQANIERSQSSSYYPIDAMKAFYAAKMGTSGYLDSKTFQNFLTGSRSPSHGTCECTLAGTFNRLRYFCGFASNGNLLMSDEQEEKLEIEIVMTLRRVLGWTV